MVSRAYPYSLITVQSTSFDGEEGGLLLVGQLVPSIDWVTATSDDPSRAGVLAIYCNHLLAEEVKRGNPRGPWGHHGYLGWDAGAVQFGERGDGLIVRVAGSYANECYASILDLGMRPSRIDACVTVWTGNAHADLANKGKEDGRRFAKTAKHPCTYPYYDADDGTGTLYVGSWKSIQFGRLYDRGSKTGLPSDAGAWRYEVCLKDERAQAAAAGIRGSGDPRGTIRSSVHRYFHSRGVIPVFEPGGSEVYSEGVREPTDDDRKLEWLREQVAPSIAELIARRGLSTVANALDLEGAIWKDGWARAIDTDQRRRAPSLEIPLHPRMVQLPPRVPHSH